MSYNKDKRVGKIVMQFHLKQLREDRGLSQQDLAFKCGLSISTIQKYENGVKKQYSHEIIEKFCEVLDCEPGDLFTLERLTA